MAGSIIDRIEAALEKARWRKLDLRGLYLDHEDYADFAYAETIRFQQETGSQAMLWPLSYDNVLILGAKAVPVKGAGRSAVYANSGEEIRVAKRLSPRVDEAA
jgi:hypothetical protein